MIKRLLLCCFVLLVACSDYKPPKASTKIQPTNYAKAQMLDYEGYWLEVQIPQRRLLLMSGDKLLKIYTVAIGHPDFHTPIGVRKINTVIWNPWWVPPKSSWVEDPTPIGPRDAKNPLGEIKMPIGNGYLIHGTKDIPSLGNWASHGCIRMLSEDLFSIVKVLLSHQKVSAFSLMEKANANPDVEFSTATGKEVPVVLSYEPVIVRGDNVYISPDFYKQYANFADKVAQEITPYLKEGQSVSEKKIKRVLKLLKKDTMIVPMNSLVSTTSP